MASKSLDYGTADRLRFLCRPRKGHITILRFSDPFYAGYIGAYLLSVEGQIKFIDIFGSSGQAEIYPQEIGRIWIRPANNVKIQICANSLESASQGYNSFRRDLQSTLFNVL